MSFSAEIRATERRILGTERKKNKGRFDTGTPSTLRQEQVLRTGQPTYKFDFNKSPADLVTEIKLDRNDTFLATAINIFLLREDRTRLGSGQLLTYPNPVIFPGPESEGLNAVYNGNIQLTVEQKIIFQNWSTHKFRRVQDTQHTAAGLRDSYQYGDGTVLPVPYPRLFGNQKNVFEVRIPTWVNQVLTAADPDFDNKIVMVLEGTLMTGINIAK